MQEGELKEYEGDEECKEYGTAPIRGIGIVSEGSGNHGILTSATSLLGASKR
jgi:hypothetical protein